MQSSSSASARLIDYRATLDRRHDYQIRLPADWAVIRCPHDPPDGPIARRLGWFVSQCDADLSLEVRCVKVTWEADPLELVELHLEQAGATVIDRASTWSASGITGELLVHRLLDDGKAATLVRVLKDADLVYMLFAHTSVAGLAAHEVTLRDALRSFRLLHPKGGLAEPLLPAGARLPVDHGFLFPASFRLQVDETSNAALVGYQLFHKALADAAGTIFVVAMARRKGDHENTSEVAASTRRVLAKRGLVLPAVQPEQAAALDRRLPTWAAVGDGRHAAAHVETELVLARHDEAWFVLARASAKRDTNGPAWLASRRAFSIVRERFAMQPEGEH
jgi:hypothetical protein